MNQTFDCSDNVRLVFFLHIREESGGWGIERHDRLFFCLCCRKRGTWVWYHNPLFFLTRKKTKYLATGKRSTTALLNHHIDLRHGVVIDKKINRRHKCTGKYKKAIQNNGRCKRKKNGWYWMSRWMDATHSRSIQKSLVLIRISIVLLIKNRGYNSPKSSDPYYLYNYIGRGMINTSFLYSKSYYLQVSHQNSAEQVRACHSASFVSPTNNENSKEKQKGDCWNKKKWSELLIANFYGFPRSLAETIVF